MASPSETDADVSGEGESSSASPFPLLTHRTLPTRHRLWKSSCCPTMDLAALTSSSTAAAEAAGAGTPSKNVGDASSSSGKGKAPAHEEALDDEGRHEDDTVSLYRLGGSAPKLWDWSTSSLAQTGLNASDNFDVEGSQVRLPSTEDAAPAGGRKEAWSADGKAKGARRKSWEKAEYKIDAMDWCPDGKEPSLASDGKHT